MGKDFDQNIYKKAHNVTPNVYPGPAKPGNEVSFCLLFLKNPLEALSGAREIQVESTYSFTIVK